VQPRLSARRLTTKRESRDNLQEPHGPPASTRPPTPYLAIGCLIAAGLAGIEQRLCLPPEATGDPATCHGASEAEHAPQRLPETLDQALAALRHSQVIPAAMGADLYDAFTAVRAAEAETFQGQDPAAIAAAYRWRY